MVMVKDTFKLNISMVPQVLWGENLHKRLSREEWNRLRAKQFERSPNCEFCGSTPIGSARHAHEVWVYDAKVAVARLVGLRTICRMCHFATHPGFVQSMVDKGHFSEDIYDEIEHHFCIVNNCKPVHHYRHQQQAERRYRKLEEVKSWTIDFGSYAEVVRSGRKS
jgi:hypothetical protein